jgi:chromosome partitioning protein
MLTISALSLSGGQGKSTTILFLAKLLAEAGYTVLVVDADPQGNLTTFLGHDVAPNEPTLLEVIKATVSLEDGIYPVKGYETLFLIPADDALEGVQDYLSTSGIGALMLKQRLEAASKDFDICLIDPPPQRFQMSRSVVVASDQIIIPVEANVKGFGSLVRTMASIAELKALKVCNAEVLAVLPFRDRWVGLSRTKECDLWLEYMKSEAKEELGEDAFLPSIRESTKIVKAISAGQSLSSLSEASEKYPIDAPFQELLKKINTLTGKKAAGGRHG